MMKTLALLLASAILTDNAFGGNEPTEDTPFLANLATTRIPDECLLPEIVLGREDAPNTVIVYSSFSCTHCRKFHSEELPKFKKKYIDTGKAKIYLRCYLDDLASFESAALVRCFGKNSVTRIEKMYDKIFVAQKEWLKSADPKKFLRDIFVKFGHKKEKIEACIKNKKISAGLMREQQRAVFDHKVLIIPAFIVNGKLHNGQLSCEKLAAMLDGKSEDEPSSQPDATASDDDGQSPFNP
jgi:protein-disulfide isomerase